MPGPGVRRVVIRCTAICDVLLFFFSVGNLLCMVVSTPCRCCLSSPLFPVCCVSIFSSAPSCFAIARCRSGVVSYLVHGWQV